MMQAFEQAGGHIEQAGAGWSQVGPALISSGAAGHLTGRSMIEQVREALSRQGQH